MSTAEPPQQPVAGSRPETKQMANEPTSSTSQCTSCIPSKIEALCSPEHAHAAANPSKLPSMQVNVKQQRCLAGL